MWRSSVGSSIVADTKKVSGSILGRVKTIRSYFELHLTRSITLMRFCQVFWLPTIVAGEARTKPCECLLLLLLLKIVVNSWDHMITRKIFISQCLVGLKKNTHFLSSEKSHLRPHAFSIFITFLFKVESSNWYHNLWVSVKNSPDSFLRTIVKRG